MGIDTINKFIKTVMKEIDDSFGSACKVVWIGNEDAINNEMQQHTTLPPYYPEKESFENSNRIIRCKEGCAWCKCDNDKMYEVNFFEFIVERIMLSDERLRRGLLDIEETYFEDKKYDDYKNADTLSVIYAEYVLEKNNLPNRAFITSLSAETYEKNDSCAKMLLCKNHTSSLLKTKFDKPTVFCDDNRSLIRKYMELTRDSKCALRLIYDDKWKIIGLDTRKENDYELNFNGKLNWELRDTKGMHLLSFYKGKYSFTNPPNNSDEDEILLECIEEHKKIAKEVLELLRHQRHGTSAVISDKDTIKSEVNRLCTKMNKGIKIHDESMKLSDLDDDSKLALSNIDGAILIDTDGDFHAIGVVVDGETIIKGETSRGARYNSLKNYIHWASNRMNANFTCVIVSEDGICNVFSIQSKNDDEKALLNKDKSA